MATSLFPEWMQSILLLIFIGLAIALALQQTKELKKLQMPTRKKVYTIVRCGEKETRRDYKEGDYVGKKVECQDGVGLITKIYAIYPKTDKNEKPMKT
ncbi:MAG: hypothetical protein F7C37_07140 [Desulfurococcales archaeon]|nr:hypothetical protein [Desulfurococcales archaeon]